MNAPAHVPNVCERGHYLSMGRCIACEKAPIDTALHEKARRAVKARRAARKSEPCPLHAGEVGKCPRCKAAHEANAKELAETVPFHERWRHFVVHEPTPEMIRESSRMFAHPATCPLPTFGGVK